MEIETIKATLLSEIEGLEESLQIIKRRVKEGGKIGLHTNVTVSKINNLIGKYQLLTEMVASEEEAIEAEKPCGRSSEDLSEIRARQTKMLRKS